MNQHLSEDQLSKCIAGQAAKADLRHIEQCSKCSAELERFGKRLSLFREAIRGRIDRRVELQPAIRLRPDQPRVSRWRWVLAAVAASGMVVFAMLQFFTSENTPADDANLVSSEIDAITSETDAITSAARTVDISAQTYLETSPDAIMDRVNLHLSRTIPAPMEPMLSLIRENEFITESGGVQ